METSSSLNSDPLAPGVDGLDAQALVKKVRSGVMIVSLLFSLQYFYLGDSTFVEYLNSFLLLPVSVRYCYINSVKIHFKACISKFCHGHGPACVYAQGGS